MASKKTDHVHQTALQRKIFTRWINQKLIPAKRQPIQDCVTDFADGTHLVDLIEVLSEKTSNLGLKPQDKRMQQIDNANRALKFVFESGVEMKLKPSAENLVDKDEGQVLALVWGIMLRFLKFGDDEDTEKLSAEDALLMWCRNQCAPVGLQIDNFSKGFQDGLAFCAIMNKYRPKILDYASLDKSDVEGNLKKAFAAAEHCFGLEQYLAPSDIPLLDSKAMLVYVAEYYMGAAQMRKTDLAVRRVTKVINYTRINDALRAEYTATAKPLRDRLDDALRRLREHVIDNTMSGARANLAAFEKYKQTEKGANIGDFLRIENVFNNLSRRLTDHQRPGFAPGATLTPPELSQTLSDIEEAEKVKKKALHDELNRQIKLANIYARHTARAAKLKAWTDDKLAYITTKEAVDSSNAAKYHLNRLAAYKAEVENTRAHSWEGLKAQGAELLAEKFEHSATVQASEAAINGALEAMDAAAVKKQATLDDDLARELYKEKTMLTHQQQDERFRALDGWIKEKIAYTAKKEEINSVSDAQLQLSLLAAYESNKSDLTATSVPGYKALAQELLDSSYKSDLSSWEYPLKSEVSGRLSHIDNSWNTLATQSATKKAILEDDLARETYREEIRLANMEHIDRHAKIAAWVEQKEAYLAVREEIDTVDKAQVAIQGLESYNSENADQTKTTVVSFKALGQKILTAEYKTSLSQWISPDRGAVTERHNFVDAKWETLAKAAAEKKAFLDAELARELKKEELRLKIANLGGDFLLWSSKQLEDVEGAQFGFLLEEVEAYGAVMAASTATIEADGSTKLSAFTVVFQEAVNTGVKDNRYSSLTPNDLQDSFAKLQAATAARKTAYDAELARQRANDALDHQFADLVDPFLKEIEANKQTISTSTKDLKEQLAFVNSCLGDQAAADKLPKVKELNDAITAAGFDVRYTTISALDVSIAWENYQTFLSGKAKALADEIQHRELRGVSSEEYAEIESQFKQFDKNGNGKLDAKEFKACLYSLGEEKPTKEVIEVMKKFGGDTTIGYDGFKEFMISTLGDVDTKPEISEGLQLINRGHETAKYTLMNELFKDEDMQWFCKEAPKVGDDYDYNAFTEQVFAR